MSYRIKDHEGNNVVHGRALVNGVRLHYMTAGEGDPVLLLHGVPKTSYHWRHVIPLLTPHHRVVVPDMRGLGDSQDRKSTRLNSSHANISYAVFCLKKNNNLPYLPATAAHH